MILCEAYKLQAIVAACRNKVITFARRNPWKDHFIVNITRIIMIVNKVQRKPV